MLYSDGTSRFDIGQGSLGTCWFLSILNSMADKPEFLSQVIILILFSSFGYNNTLCVLLVDVARVVSGL